MSSFIIKIIACLTMIIDHIKYAIPETRNFVTLYLGRTSFPLFAFLLSEGYCHTSNLKKYYIRLSIFAVISQIPFMLFRTLVGEWKLLNIMFTLLLGLIAITVYDKIDKEYISFPICILIIYLGKLLNVDYSWFGVCMILILYIFRKDKLYRNIAYTVVTIFGLYYMVGITELNKDNLIYSISYFLPLILINFYNGEEGKKIKYFYYLFYPVHMLILYGISFL